jgi:hypothetical protein
MYSNSWRSIWPGAHRVRRSPALENLEVRLLVEAEHNLALFR